MVIGAHDAYAAPGVADVHANYVQIDTGYFATMGIPMLAGRDFGRDAGKSNQAIVNRAFAEQAFPGKNPLGQHFGARQRSFEVIAVVGNSKLGTLGEETRACVYLPLGEHIMSLSGVALVVKASAPAAMIEPVRREIEKLDPNLAVFNAVTMREQAEKAMLLPRLTAVLFTIFG